MASRPCRPVRVCRYTIDTPGCPDNGTDCLRANTDYIATTTGVREDEVMVQSMESVAEFSMDAAG